MTTPRVPAATAGPVSAGATNQPSARAVRRGPSILARKPEIVPIASTALAWATLAAVSPLSSWMSLGPAGDATGGPLSGTHPGHGGIFTPAGLAMVALMTVAMMAPLAIPGVRTVAFTSAWWRAGRASLWFFAAFIVTWTVLAVCLAPVAELLAGVLGSAAVAAGILTAACATRRVRPAANPAGQGLRPAHATARWTGCELRLRAVRPVDRDVGGFGSARCRCSPCSRCRPACW